VEAEPVVTIGTKPEPSLELAVNFGIFAGREASRPELERLGEALLAVVEGASVIAENRLEVGRESLVLLHQVRVEVAAEALPGGDAEAVRDRVAATVGDWARTCIEGFALAEMTEGERLAQEAVVDKAWSSESS
jgi:hypothetical protein